ncbi:DUF4421 domain-containing protein [Persicobacter diffluens]|uniref:DUF4421 domain-containing protein n=1 Tax=Persicobacter diffluens TaxID=981 RepID=A0AAN4VUT1_9BACT|nr:hypothetical protein PEDI_00280 [Persicobacter diffluens]
MKGLLFFLLVFPLSLLAQKNDREIDERNFVQRLLGINNAQKWSHYDTTFIKDYSQDWTLRIFTANKFNQFAVFNKDREVDQSLLYEPTPSTNLGLGFNHNWLGVNASFNFPSSSNSHDLQTSMMDMQVNVYDVKLVGEFRLQRYQGYHVQHLGWEDWIKPTERALDVQLAYPNLTTSSFSGNLAYVFNWRKFSYRSSFIQTQRQLQSAGSWLAGATYFLSSIYNDGEGILGESSIHFPEMNFQKSLAIGAGLMGGYGYNLVIRRNFYTSLTFMLGPSYNYTNLEYLAEEPNAKEFRMGFCGVSRFSIGYNKANWFLGIHSALQWNAIFYEKTGLNSYNGSFRFVVGKRFDWKLKGRFFKIVGLD